MPCQQGLSLKLVAHWKKIDEKSQHELPTYHHLKLASAAVRYVNHFHVLSAKLLQEFGLQVMQPVATIRRLWQCLGMNWVIGR